MAEENNDRVTGKNDNAAKMLAIVALVIALVALGWAMKADKHAADAANTANQVQRSNSNTGTGR